MQRCGEAPHHKVTMLQHDLPSTKAGTIQRAECNKHRMERRLAGTMRAVLIMELLRNHLPVPFPDNLNHLAAAAALKERTDEDMRKP